jgi:hypothetical protein
MSNLFADLQKETERQKNLIAASSEKPTKKTKPTRKSTRNVTPPREVSSDKMRDTLREKSRDWPTRDEIQEFSFRLRDDLKVKVQAEVPHQWQGELEDLARQLNVKKLELYRFIIGEFLGKVERGRGENKK